MISLVSLLIAAALVSQQCSEAYARIENSKIELDNNLLPNDITPVRRTQQRSSYVTITSPPPENVNYVPGTALVLECEVQGHPLPFAGWLKNGLPLTDFEEEVNEILPTEPSGYGRMTSRLIVNGADQGDIFTCVGTAGLKETSATTTVFVEGNHAVLMSKMLSTKPIITGFYQYVFQNMGTSLTLPCRVYSPVKAQVYWLDNNNNIIYGNSRIRVLPSGDLHIKNLTWEDMGGYTCTVKSAFGKDSMDAFLYPMKPSDITPVRRTQQRSSYVTITSPPPENVNYVPGTALVLECEVQGHPLPFAGWLKNGLPLTDFEEEVNEILPTEPSGYGRMTSRLIVNGADQGDIFTCVGTAGLKETSATTTVFVEGNHPVLMSKMLSTKPIITGFYQYVFQNMGTSLTLPCRVYSPVKAQVYWLDNNNNIIYGNSRIRVLPSGDLHIKNLTWEDMGGYTCTVKSAFGKDSMDAFLYPMKPSDITPVRRTQQRSSYVTITSPPPENVNYVPGTALVLECEVQGHPLPFAGWLKNGLPLTDFEEEVNEILPTEPSGYGRMTSRLIVNGADQGDIFTCVGTAGLKETSATTTVFVEGNHPVLMSKMLSTKPIITGFYQYVFQNMGTSLTLPCRLYSPVKAQVYWLDNNNNIIYGNSRIQVLPSGDLHIKNLTWEDMGGYTCTVKSAFGKDSMDAFLYPMKPSE